MPISLEMARDSSNKALALARSPSPARFPPALINGGNIHKLAKVNLSDNLFIMALYGAELAGWQLWGNTSVIAVELSIIHNVLGMIAG